MLFLFRCRRKCFSLICEDERILIYSKFISFNTKNEQDTYLQSLISTNPIKKRRNKPECESTTPKRGVTYIYEISTSSGKYQVCKAAFTKIHGVTNERVRRLCHLLSLGKAPLDKRGLNTPGNAKSAIVLQSIKGHIESFPAKLSHYSTREVHYLDANLNLLLMHSMYQTKYPDKQVAYCTYRKIFKEHFSLRFGRPQVDTCCTCEELNIKISSTFLNDTAKRVAVAEKMVHLKRSKKFYAELKKITSMVQSDESGEIGAICIDFMQNLELPRIPVQETFYLRQLTVNVCCIHNLKNNTATFIVYHEGIGGKSPNEVCSFLFKFISEHLKNVKHLHIFTDGCGGQNKNHTLIRLCSALVSLKLFQSVEQYYPVRGHSFLPCDRDFAVLKRKIKRQDRIFTIKEYAELILASSTKKSFTVILPTSKDIIEYKKWWPIFYKRNMLSVETIGRNVSKENKVSLKISKYCYFLHSIEMPGLLQAKPYIGGLLGDTFMLRNSNRQDLFLPSKHAYPKGKIPINKKKMADLLKLETYLPQKRRVQNFYKQIYKWPVTDKESGDIAENYN